MGVRMAACGGPAVLDATELFVRFVRGVLVPERAARYAALAASLKGQRKILDSLYHAFRPSIRPAAVSNERCEAFLDKPCLVFHARVGFVIEFATVRDAYERLSGDDGWLILLRDGTTGVHRPEDRWDDEVVVKCP